MREYNPYRIPIEHISYFPTLNPHFPRPSTLNPKEYGNRIPIGSIPSFPTRPQSDFRVDLLLGSELAPGCDLSESLWRKMEEQGIGRTHILNSEAKHRTNSKL